MFGGDRSFSAATAVVVVAAAAAARQWESCGLGVQTADGEIPAKMSTEFSLLSIVLPRGLPAPTRSSLNAFTIPSVRDLCAIGRPVARRDLTGASSV